VRSELHDVRRRCDSQVLEDWEDTPLKGVPRVCDPAATMMKNIEMWQNSETVKNIEEMNVRTMEVGQVIGTGDARIVQDAVATAASCSRWLQRGRLQDGRPASVGHCFGPRCRLRSAVQTVRVEFDRLRRGLAEGEEEDLDDIWKEQGRKARHGRSGHAACVHVDLGRDHGTGLAVQGSQAHCSVWTVAW